MRSRNEPAIGRRINVDRYEALERSKMTSRWVAGISTAATAILAAIVGFTLPGHPSAGATQSQSGTANSASPVGNSGAATGNSGAATGNSGAALTPPTTVPVRSKRAPVVISGGTSW